MTRPIRLTGRGRGMLLGGAVVAAAGAVIGSRAITAAGLFTVLVVALSAGLALTRRSRTTVERADVPSTLRSGEQFTCAVVVRNASTLRGAALLHGLRPGWAAAADQPDAGVLDLHGPQVRLARTCAADARGRHEWPPLRLELPDPLGAAHGIVTAPEAGRTVVFPRLELLGPAAVPAVLGGVWEPEDTGLRTRPAVGDASASPIPRPFRPGDQMRRIHWPATARTGEPMVRAEDAGPVRRAVVLLDCQRSSYLAADGFERAVTATASIAVRLLQLGWSVSVRTATGSVLGNTMWAQGRTGEFAVLTALAQVQFGDRGRTVPPDPHDLSDALCAVTGGGGQPLWALPVLMTLRTEAPTNPDGCGSDLVWAAGTPLAGVWAAGTAGLVAL